MHGLSIKFMFNYSYLFIYDFQTEIGKPKRRGVIIPAGTTYGRPNAERDGGSSEG